MKMTGRVYNYFVIDYLNFERNRMYPPGYGKETTMLKPKHKHVGAIIRSINLLKSGLNDDLEKRFHKAIERDLVYMGEVREMLLNMLENPTLPFVVESEPHPHPLVNPIEHEPNEAI